jgi:hypothetical protein
MDRVDVDNLLKLREFVIKQHKSLDGKGAPETSTIKQVDVAKVYTTIVKSLEDLLSEHVNFTKPPV